jgi:hypothetical protein
VKFLKEKILRGCAGFFERRRYAGLVLMSRGNEGEEMRVVVNCGDVGS